MEHPYRIHSSIGFSFLQLLLLSSLAYPTRPPPLYHTTAVVRLMGTVYFTIFKGLPLYLKFECATMILEVVCDALYIRYIIRDYTYLFGVLDIITNILFCAAIILSIQNGESRWSKISECFEGMFATVTGGGPPPYDGGAMSGGAMSGGAMSGGAMSEWSNTANMYRSLPNDEPTSAKKEYEPVYTVGGRQAFKPNFYSSSWGREYIKTKVEREFDRIDHKTDTSYGDVGMVTSSDGTTQYIRFDDADAGAGAGAGAYASIFVSPYYDKYGNQITSFSSWTKADTVGACLFIYNLLQFIYQLMMYKSIVKSCREADIVGFNTTMVRWLC